MSLFKGILPASRSTRHAAARGRWQRAGAGVLCLMLLGLSGPATAQGAGQDEQSQARDAFESGEDLYQAGEFAAAKSKFAEAYALYPLKPFLFNIAQCHFKLGEYEDAAEFYRAYSKDNEDAPNYSIVQEYILESDSRAEAQKAQETAKAAQAVADAAARDRLESEAKAKMAEKAAERAEVQRRDAERETEEQRGQLTNQWWFWPSVGIGVAAVALVVVGGGAAAATGGVLAYTDQQASQGTLGSIDGRTGNE